MAAKLIVWSDLTSIVVCDLLLTVKTAWTKAAVALFRAQNANKQHIALLKYAAGNLNYVIEICW